MSQSSRVDTSHGELDDTHGLGRKAAIEDRTSKLGLAPQVAEAKLAIAVGAADVDLTLLRGRWELEFGKVLAERMSRIVEGTIDAYEALKKVRMTV